MPEENDDPIIVAYLDEEEEIAPIIVAGLEGDDEAEGPGGRIYKRRRPPSVTPGRRERKFALCIYPKITSLPPT